MKASFDLQNYSFFHFGNKRQVSSYLTQTVGKIGI